MNDVKITKMASVVSFVILISILMTVVVQSWLSDTIYKEISVTASTRESYFERGDGSQENPFIIARPVQLYYLAWLQDLGYFNKIDNGHITQFYFKVDNTNDSPEHTDLELDMSGYIIPPIGTEQYPFIGNFDGNSCVISNVVVDNNITNFTDPPEIDTQNNVNNGVQIIGFFGVIGSTGEIIDETNIKIGDNVYSFSSAVNEVSNFLLSNATIITNNPKGNKTLVGIVAGYVNGNVNSIGVYDSTIAVKDALYPLEIDDHDNSVSYYSLVGYSKTAIEALIGDSDAPSNEWGGSIDFQTLNHRLYSAYGESSSTSGIYNFHQNNMTLSMTRSIKNDPSSKSVIYRYRDGTVIPINMDDEFNALSTNTGYIIGSSLSGATNGSPKSSSYYIDYICNSLSDQAVDYTKVFNGNQAKYNSNNLEILTFHEDSWHRITDSYNTNNTVVSSALSAYSARTVEELGFEKYNKARDALDFIFKKSDGTSESLIHGIHFDTKVPSYSNVTHTNVSILGKEYTNYPLLNSSINFNVKDSGKITFFAGTYYSISSTNYANAFNQNRSYGGYTKDTYFNDSFFSLSIITDRDPDTHSISASNFKTISKIYKDADGPSDCPYIYLYTDGSYSKAIAADDIEIFDMAVMNSRAPVSLALYYFEIPVNPGEYVMGAVSTNQTRGAYMIYLDISANGNGGETPGAEEYVTGVDFVPSTDVSILGEIGKNKSTALFKLLSGFYGNVQIKRRDSMDNSITFTIVCNERNKPYVKEYVINKDGEIININYLTS